MDLTEARYELVISVDARRSGEYDDVDKQHMRDRIYRVLEAAFVHAKVARDAVHMEDRGDGVLLSVAGRIAVTRLLGLWMVEVHEKLRDENRALRIPLGLRVGMHVGPVRHDDRGISGRAVDLACRLADSTVARQLLDAERADLVLVTSQSLYEDVVGSGGKFIEPAHYSAARLTLKEGEVTAWFHLPGRPAPEIPVAPAPSAAPVPPAPPAGDQPPTADTDAGHADAADDVDEVQGIQYIEDVQDVQDVQGAKGDDPAGTPGVHYTVHGDMSQHSDNVYQQPVHIGRITGDAGRRKG